MPRAELGHLVKLEVVQSGDDVKVLATSSHVRYHQIGPSHGHMVVSYLHVWIVGFMLLISKPSFKLRQAQRKMTAEFSSIVFTFPTNPVPYSCYRFVRVITTPRGDVSKCR
jgi:hypothetical protein